MILTIHYRFLIEETEVIGRGVRKCSNEVKNMNNARIVLKKNKDCNFILQATQRGDI